MEGDVQVQPNEMPPFMTTKNDVEDRREVLIFTSLARVDEFQALRKERKPYAVAGCDGRSVLQLVLRTGLGIVVNRGSRITKSLFMPVELIVQLLNGSMFAPLPLFIPPNPKRKPGQLAELQLCTPGEVPEYILGPVIKFIQSNPEITSVRAVKELHPEDFKKARLLIVIETKGEADFVEENFGFILRYASGNRIDCVACKLDPKTPDGKLVISKQEPFYPPPKPPKAGRKTTKKR
jgi:hypothetical protein